MATTTNRFEETNGFHPTQEDSDALVDHYRRGIERMMAVCEAAERGDFEPRILHCDPTTEIGRLGIAINGLLDRADGFIREAAAALDHASHEKFYRRVLTTGMVGAYRHAASVINLATEKMKAKSHSLADHEARSRELAATFEHEVGEVVRSLVAAADSLRGSATDVARLSEGTTAKAAEGAQATGDVAENVDRLADSAARLGASEEVANEKVAGSTKIAKEAVRQATEANLQMQSLAQATERIGDVVTLISDIAKQTNLLSLNASIEAARAGDAGRGFAVVASEVNKLALQTADSTKSIAKEIKGIQEATTRAAKSISSIAETIATVNDLASGIATAVTEQKALTGTMEENLNQARQSVRQVSITISETSEAARSSSERSGALLDSADILARQGQTLDRAVTHFLEHVRKTSEAV